MKDAIKLAVVLGMVGWLSACSSSPSGDEEDAGSTESAQADAGTDAVPSDSMENLPDPNGEKTGDQALDALPTEEPPAGEPATPEAPPAEVAAPTPSEPATQTASSSGETTDYTVQRGDTLMKIAFETYGDLSMWKKIQESNQDRIHDPNHLAPGTTLKLERPASSVSIDRNGEKYLIKKGDTLGTISDDVYGTKKKWKRIYENNRQLIKDPDKIYAGFYLYYQFNEQDQSEKEQFLKNKPATLSEAVPAMGNEPGAVAEAPTTQAQAAPGLIGTPNAGTPRAPASEPAK